MIKALYSFIQYQLLQQVPELKFIGMFNNQFTNIEGERDLPFPAALIEIKPFTLDQMGCNYFSAKVNFNIHLATELYMGTEMNDKQQNAAFNHLSIIDKCGLMHNKKMDAINPIDVPAYGDTYSGIVYDYSEFRTGGIDFNGISIIPSMDSSLQMAICHFSLMCSSSYNVPQYTYGTFSYGITYSVDNNL